MCPSGSDCIVDNRVVQYIWCDPDKVFTGTKERSTFFKKREKVPTHTQKKKSLLKNARSKCLRYQIIKKSAEIETLNTLSG